MRTATRIKLASLVGTAAAVLAVALAGSPTPRTTAGGQIPKGGGGGLVVPGAPAQGGGTESEIAQQKAQRVAPQQAPAPGTRAAPTFPPGLAFPRPGGPSRGYISRVGSFELAGPTGTGLYRWLEVPQDRRNPYRFWRSELAFEGRERVLFGGAGSNVPAAPRPINSFVYRDVSYPFWLAFGDRPNPDGTGNIAFSLDRRSWYWWDDDARGFDPTASGMPLGVPGRP